MSDPILPYLNKINSFTIQGGSHLHFELSQEPNDLIGAIFWQLKRIKIEKYEPIVIGASLETKEEPVKKVVEEVKAMHMPVEKSRLKSNLAYVKEYNRLLEQHNLPTSRMGDIDWYLRQKFNCDSQ